MTVRVGINGFGRIGRNIARAVLKYGEDLEVVAINDPASPEVLTHLLEFDSVLGRFDHPVTLDGNTMTVDGHEVHFSQATSPAEIPWKEHGVDLVIESSGFFTTGEQLRGHLEAGAKKVVLSAPGKGVDGTFVHGVNDDLYDPSTMDVVSAASCTTNCLAPLAKVMNDSFGIVAGLMTTIHSYTGDQRLLDAPHKDLRRARAAALNMVPTTTGAAAAVGLVLPELAGKLDGFAVRVPTPNVSMVDLTFTAEKPVSVESVNAAVREAAAGPMQGIIEYSEEALVSKDIEGYPVSTVFDAPLTKVLGDQVKVIAWYDNEWGYTVRLVDFVSHVASTI